MFCTKQTHVWTATEQQHSYMHTTATQTPNREGEAKIKAEIEKEGGG